jgi:hypothetical protein
MPEIEDAGLDIDFDQELARIQGEAAQVEQPPPAAEVEIAEGTVVTSARTVEFMGARFRVADKIGLMPLLKFSAHADMSTNDPGALAAMYSMLKDCIHEGNPGCGKCPACKAGDERDCAEFDPGDWRRFEQHAIDTKADADELLDVITKVIELIAGRPTGQPSTSSPGRRSIRDGSTARSSARGRRGSRR